MKVEFKIKDLTDGIVLAEHTRIYLTSYSLSPTLKKFFVNAHGEEETNWELEEKEFNKLKSKLENISDLEWAELNKESF